jgi:uncharacterized protein
MGNPVAWFEIVGRDGQRLRAFYGELFDWKITTDDSDMDYGLVPAAEGGIGGGIGRSQDGGAGQVTFYVEVDDPAAYLAKAERLGGQTILPPMEIPGYNLTVALLADPEGHVIGLAKGVVQ